MTQTGTMRNWPRRLCYFRTHEDNPVQVDAFVGPDGVKITGGYGRWEEVQRRGRKSLTSWSGTDPFKLTVSIMIDGFITNDQIEDSINDLESMARRFGGAGHPPLLHFWVYGQVPRSLSWTWVINNIEWGDSIKRYQDGKRTRQYATVELMEWVDPDVIKISKHKDPKQKARTWIYKTHKGDTLKKIASQHLHSAKRWTEIRKLNPKFRDPNKAIRPNTHLKMPPRNKK